MGYPKWKFESVVIIVKNIEKTVKFYSDTFGWETPKRGEYSKINTVDTPGNKHKWAMVSTNIQHPPFIQLVEPETGPLVKLLKEKGEGAICALCFEVDNIEEFYEKMKEIGITPVNQFNKPIKKEDIPAALNGNRFMYLPSEKTCGSRIEIIQRVAR